MALKLVDYKEEYDSYQGNTITLVLHTYGKADVEYFRDHLRQLVCSDIERIVFYTSDNAHTRVYDTCANVSFDIKKVIYNNPATIVLWKDGTKTVVKCQENDTYDPEKGLAMCFAKKALDNKGHYMETFKKWQSQEDSADNNFSTAIKRVLEAYADTGEEKTTVVKSNG